MIRSSSNLPCLNGIDIDWLNQVVMVRFDLNVPVVDGRITDDTRIRSCLPTLNFLISKGAKVIIISHRGQIKDQLSQEIKEKLSLFAVANVLEEILGKKVFFHHDCIGGSVDQRIKRMNAGDVLMLENLRFYTGEVENDANFAKNLSELANFYINDAFSVSHRCHASVVGLPAMLPHAAGINLQKEYKIINEILSNVRGPFVAVVGGAKVSSKLKLLSFMLQKVDLMLIGGAMANTFLKAKGYFMGSSLVEEDLVPVAADLLEQYAHKIVLPLDLTVVKKNHEDSCEKTITVDMLEIDHQAFDIGTKTVDTYQKMIKEAKTLIMNGPMGMFEDKRFCLGSAALVKFITTQTKKGDLFSAAGGGDTLALLQQEKCKDGFSFLSTGGGAFLSCLQGESLPGIASLMN